MTRTTFQSDLLNNGDVCSNCFGVRLVAPEPAQPTARSRNPQTTSVEHVPGDRPPHDVELFCECGVPDANTRIWDIEDVDDERFKSLLVQAIRTAEHRGHDLDRRKTISVAVERWRHDWSVNRALDAGFEAGVEEPTTPTPAD